MIEAGGEDMEKEEDHFVVTTAFEDLHTVADELKKQDMPLSAVSAVYLPTTTVDVTGDHAKGLLKLLDALEDNDDVTHVWSNFEMDDSELESLEPA